MRITLTDKMHKVVRVFDVDDDTAGRIEDFLPAQQSHGEFALQGEVRTILLDDQPAVRELDKERELRTAFEQLLREALRLGYVDESKASQSWLTEAKRLLGI